MKLESGSRISMKLQRLSKSSSQNLQNNGDHYKISLKARMAKTVAGYFRRTERKTEYILGEQQLRFKRGKET
jgi:hypothetical protein